MQPCVQHTDRSLADLQPGLPGTSCGNDLRVPLATAYKERRGCVSSPVNTGKTPRSLRFATLQIKFILRADMKFWKHSNIELLQAAEMAHWYNDQKLADYIMEELAHRIVEEHPPDVERLEIEFEEGSEETGPAYEVASREDDNDSWRFERGSN
jgi:hypothetical protein